MRLLLSLLVWFIPLTASASYRVYKLRVTHFSKQGKPTKKETILATVDHLQYEHLHGGFRTMQVELEDTWYCPGDTSRRPLCTFGKQKFKRGLASTDPKRGGLSYSRQPVIP